VIIDASFTSAKHRAAATATAADTSTISDADWQIAQDMAAVTDPWPDALAINTDSGGITGDPGQLTQQALRGPPIRPRTPLAPHPALHEPRVSRDITPSNTCLAPGRWSSPAGCARVGSSSAPRPAGWAVPAWAW